MKDRISGSPGRHKAKISLDQLDALQKGEEFSITLTRDDEPVIDGTPYSKAAVLPDALAAQLCPDMEDPAPKDAFQALADRMLESQEHPGCYYRMVNGEKEWINPPMEQGQEYRTMERHNGRTVYVKKIDLGYLPKSSSSGKGESSVTHGLSEEFLSFGITVISAETIAWAKNSSLCQPFPFMTNDGELRGKIHVNYEAIHIFTFNHTTDYTAMTTLRYVKGETE